MRILKTIAATLAGLAMLNGAAFASVNAYVKVPVIIGETPAAAGEEHEIEYDIVAGKIAGKTGDITLKRGTMVPAFERSYKTGKPIRSMTVVIDGAEYELTNVEVTSIRGGKVSIAFEQVSVKYTQQADDRGA
jgi:hypothetical protein